MTGQPFPQEITAGGQLIVPQVYSPNFSLVNQTGWAILSNGNAYFFNITASGSVTANSVIIEGSSGNILIYNGIPATGTLVGSWTGAAGIDPYNNSYPQGIAIGALSNTEIQIRPDLDGMFFYAA